MRREFSTAGLAWSMLALTALLTATAAEPARAQASGRLQAAVPAALVPALEQMKTELALTDEQTSQAGRLMVERLARAAGAVESFGGISFDSVLDLLVEARSFRDEFIPELTALLTGEQKAKLAALPKAHKVYTAAMAGWFAQARVDKMRTRINLTDAQVPDVQAALLDEFRDAIGIVEGFVSKDSEKSTKSAILDLVVDLRAVQRQGQRRIERLLTTEQQQALKAYRVESEEKSEKADTAKKSGGSAQKAPTTPTPTNPQAPKVTGTVA